MTGVQTCALPILVLSEGSVLDDGEKEELAALHIRAAVVLPVTVGGRIRLYACFDEQRQERTWQVEEIKFLKDTVRVLQNILTRREHHGELVEIYDSFENLLQNAGSCVYIRSLTTGEPLFVNRGMQCEFDVELREGSLYGIIEEALRPDNGYGEIFLERREKWYELHYTRINWQNQQPALFCALYDETEKKIYQKKLEQQAYTDFLTGLYNRICCEKDLAGWVMRAKANSQKGALLYLDLDDFKNINEGLGHQYGDVLLKTIAHSLRRIPGIEDSCYRMGGDEFIDRKSVV